MGSLQIVPAISLEARTGYTSTLLFSYEPGFAWVASGNKSNSFFLLPKFKFAYRHFVNIMSRIDNNRPTYKYSGTFISLNSYYIQENNYTQSAFILGPTIGLQRNFANTVHFSVELGTGCNFHDNIGGYIGDLKAGIAF